MRRSDRRAGFAQGVLAWVILCALGAPWPAAAELARDDRRNLEELLGEGVVGAAVPGNPLSDSDRVFDFADGEWTFRFESGKRKGETEQVRFKRLKRDNTGRRGQLEIGSKDVLFLRRDESGNILVTSEQDLDENVITRYEPPEFFYASDVPPGGSKTRKIAVKVFDLHHPDHLAYTGELDLTYRYLGVYRVKLPGGSYDAALLRWDYSGKVGPAKIEDFQYRLLVPGVGVVAMIEKKNITAVLVYRDHSKSGRVLLKGH